ncbi:MAG: CBS domain-containing protein [Novosphingobium sp.]
MTIARLLEGRSDPTISCDAGLTVEQAIAKLAEHRIGALPVLEQSRVVGIFSERDVLYQLHERGPAMLVRTVREAMTSPAEVVTPDTEVLAALGLMTRRRIRHLPVMQGESMVGFVSIGDLVKYRIDLVESEAEAMRAYIQTA